MAEVQLLADLINDSLAPGVDAEVLECQLEVRRVWLDLHLEDLYKTTPSSVTDNHKNKVFTVLFQLAKGQVILSTYYRPGQASPSPPLFSCKPAGAPRSLSHIPPLSLSLCVCVCTESAPVIDIHRGHCNNAGQIQLMSLRMLNDIQSTTVLTCGSPSHNSLTYHKPQM